MDVSVIVVSYNTKDLLRECIRSIYRETREIEYEVFVVDNRSTDGSPDMVKGEFPKVRLIRNDLNVGFAAGNNIALKKGRGRYFLLLNPDTQLVNNAIGILADYMDSHRDVGASGCMLLDGNKEVQMVCRKFSRIAHEVGELMPVINRCRWRWMSRNYLSDEFDYRSCGETDYVQGACLMVRRVVIEEIGLMDERYFMYSEEEDWCYRMKRKGWKVMYVSSAVVVHYQGMSTRQHSSEMLVELYRSKFQFFSKNYGIWRARFLKIVLVTMMAFSVPYFTIVSLVRSGRREYAREYRDQSLMILRTMLSST
jgi:hypothetical protein